MNKQYNYITNKDYQGRNQVDLMVAKEKNKFKSDAWLTFLQANDKNLKIKKGSKSVSVFLGYEKFSELKTVKEGGEEKQKLSTVSRPLGFARVFNLDQTEKLTKEQLMLRKEAKKNFRKVYFRKFN
jgi:antirestriction protein ArdC